MADKYDTVTGGQQGYFPTTMWTQVLSVKDRGSGDFRDKLDYLIKLYWKPVYKYIKGWVKSNEAAKDLTQEFFTQFMIRDILKPVSPEKGRFRTYLKALLKHFLLDIKKGEETQKRGGGARYMSFNEIKEDKLNKGSGTIAPDDLFDKEWATCVINEAVKKMREDLAAQDKELYFQIFEMYDLSPDTTEQVTYKKLAAKLSIKESDVRNHLVHARKLFRKKMIEEITNYLSNPDDAEQELKTLLNIT